jgi:hypothetical protein
MVISVIKFIVAFFVLPLVAGGITCFIFSRSQFVVGFKVRRRLRCWPDFTQTYCVYAGGQDNYSNRLLENSKANCKGQGKHSAGGHYNPTAIFCIRYLVFRPGKN